ncbi:MAG TPA: M48 family metalloprotease [bacterium]|nr:M48 family metalloprotease [bacterium]
MKRSLALFAGALMGLTLLWGASSCSGINLFSVQDDKDLGAQVDDEIKSSPSDYPLLDESDYPAAYAYLRDIRDEILDSGEVAHRDDFVWEVNIIHDDSVLNAFATPGGYLYFYTGLIKYLDSEDHFAGVMGHEITHAAERHSTEALTEVYGVDLLLSAALGDDLGIVQDIASGLSALAFSRDNEADADAHSVEYLAKTRYACDGAAGFFEKLIAEGDAGSPPEFLSTHPNPDNRVEAIHDKAANLGCDTTPSGRDYQAFKDMLP